jgi:hypothetical protein
LLENGVSGVSGVHANNGAASRCNPSKLSGVSGVSHHAPETRRWQTDTAFTAYYGHLMGSAKLANCCYAPALRFCAEGERLRAAYFAGRSGKAMSLESALTLFKTDVSPVSDVQANSGADLADTSSDTADVSDVSRDPPPDRLYRCECYLPDANDPDRRPGAERWPSLVKKINPQSQRAA